MWKVVEKIFVDEDKRFKAPSVLWMWWTCDILTGTCVQTPKFNNDLMFLLWLTVTTVI